MQGFKHLITCRCMLQQFKTKKNPPLHGFVVFSVVGDDNFVLPKYAQCNNCGVVHKVTDLCKSEIMGGKESMPSIVGIDDVKLSLHKNYVDVLEKNSADLATWENVQFLVENKMWGSHVVLTSELNESTRAGKIVIILGESLLKVDSFMREESFSGS